ncbi:SDR family oxidoreductase [Frankia sp. AgB32]|uniref:SDR family NAD(P)-dependent oxidoreductase n=1 Tax=Frankia sp. AgB32 TaxID=631119 RepID=UPI00200CC391|nr:SDR family NAD(P)-dependent oxidoreductase [Frankia sp. AgB32]MCK9896997.1 SDR family NAD(P)-dependent oxidoreductase [Frankia sp. AgB32]
MRAKVAVVTGAGSGIGRALALGLARRGARLALADIDPAGLAETARRAVAVGAEVHTREVDVGDRAAVATYATDVAAHFGTVHQLYNNAGIAGTGVSFLDAEWAVFERVLSVNLWGVLHATKAFLPHLIDSGAGHLVNISSLNGLMAQAELGAYSTSKFGVRGFTEALRMEMVAAGHPVRVCVVHPGGVKTNIATATLAEAQRIGQDVTPEYREQVRAFNEQALRLSPQRAADIILRGVEANRPRILVGGDARVADVAVRLLPRAYPWLIGQAMRRSAR